MSKAETGADGVRSGDGAAVSQKEQTNSSDDGRSASPAETRPLLVLIVEDEEPIANAIAMIVRDAGYRALLAAQGQQALELAKAEAPALVITDLMMPQFDGAELIKALRAQAAIAGASAPPIILITAAGPRRAEAAGADVVLRKPFNMADLDALLRRFLGPAPAE